MQKHIKRRHVNSPSMVKVLSTVNWGEPALDLLSHCCNLDQGKPAVMHIRHTERPLIDDMEDGHNTLPTPTGREAARARAVWRFHRGQARQAR